MTPNDIATNWIAMKDFCRCCRSTYHQQQLAQAYLALESRIQKLESVVEAARDLQDSAYYSGYFDLDKALEELDQP